MTRSEQLFRAADLTRDAAAAFRDGDVAKSLSLYEQAAKAYDAIEGREYDADCVRRQADAVSKAYPGCTMCVLLRARCTEHVERPRMVSNG